MEIAREAAKKSGIPDSRIYILEVPEKFAGKKTPSGVKTVDDFIREGAKLDRLEPLHWDAGDGARRSAFLCYSSGTSGLPVSPPLSLQSSRISLKIFHRKES